ncbi:MAG: hypothetical protein ABIR37_04090 [Candidatus Saccharimonadales bacterium]
MSGKLITATVEIYHDSLSGRQPTEGVVAGLDIVSAVAGSIEISRDDQLMRIGREPDQEIDFAKIRWPRFKSDFAIVLSNRAIKLDVDNEEEGYLVRCAGIASYAFRVAIINAATVNLATAVAHETGHLFGLKADSDKLNPIMSGHCPTDSCVMHWGHAIATEQVALPSKSQTGRLLERLKLKDVQYQRREVETRKEFCDECTDELGTTGKLRALDKIGIHVPR